MSDRIRVNGVDRDYWQDHDEFADWQFEVANGDTRQGFWEWLDGRDS